MPTTSATKTCPGCGTLVSAIRPTCRHCGTLLMPPPAPPAPLGAAPVATPEASAPTTPSGDARFFAPATLEPVAVIAAPPPKRRSPALAAVIVIAVIVLGGGAYALVGGNGTSHAKTPVALAPHGASNGLPGGLADAVRIQAESSRQLAFSAIAQASSEGDANALDLQRLSALSGSLTFHDATTSSKGPHDVSFAQDGDVKTIAIAASSKEACAFGRFQAGTVSQYVTMINMSSCRAIDAPADGWSELQGGSSSDLPPEH